MRARGRWGPLKVHCSERKRGAERCGGKKKRPKKDQFVKERGKYKAQFRERERLYVERKLF